MGVLDNAFEEQRRLIANFRKDFYGKDTAKEEGYLAYKSNLPWWKRNSNKARNLFDQMWNAELQLQNFRNARIQEAPAANSPILATPPTPSTTKNGNTLKSGIIPQLLRTKGVDFNSVESVLQFLNKNGANIVADNMYGAKTKKAIEDYMANNALTLGEIDSFNNLMKTALFYKPKLTVVPSSRDKAAASDNASNPVQRDTILESAYNPDEKFANDHTFRNVKGLMSSMNPSALYEDSDLPYKFTPSKDSYYTAKDLEWDARSQFKRNYGKHWTDPSFKMYYDYAKSTVKDAPSMSDPILQLFENRYVKKKQGGKMNKFQQGGTVDPKLQVVQLVKAAMGGDLKATQAILKVIEAAKKGDLQAVLLAQLIQETMKTIQSSSVMARLGAKLNYLKKVNGTCKQGEVMTYFREGGRLRCGCALKGTKLDKEDQKVVRNFREDMRKAKDLASRDSIAINKYNDLEVMSERGHKGKFNGGNTWIPDRKKYKVDKNKCGSKMKK